MALGRVTVVGLGPAGADLLTAGALALLAEPSGPLRLRTARHPAAAELAGPGGVLEGAVAFDPVYDAAGDIDAVYRTIVEELVALAVAEGAATYVVPGSPLVAERTVVLLRSDDRVVVDVRPALSFVELAWARLGIDPLAAGVRLVDGHRVAVEAAGEQGPLLVAQCDSSFVLSDLKLLVDDPPTEPVVLLHHLGLADERVIELAWSDLDRTLDPDHLTSVYVPRLRAPIFGEVVRLTEMMHTLRRECPWDREQTHQSLVRHLVEETYEVVEALEAVDPDTGAGYDELEEELGDLLFQVVFHAELASEAGQFTLADVARSVHDKLHGRHPHVFGDVVVDGPGGVEANWDRIKRAEKGRESAMDGIPAVLPALLLALKTHERAARAGMPFPTVERAWAKVSEELDELRADPGARELGDLLFATAGLARELDVEPEAALRAAADRFAARFRYVEAQARAQGVDLHDVEPATVDAWWEAAKRTSEAAPPPG